MKPGRPIIGILGGMGPRATVQFEQMLLQRLRGNDQELPTIITINDGSIPDRTSFLIAGGTDPLPRMQRNLLALELLGASIVCVPCNTACAPAIFGRLQPTSSVVINLPEEVGDELVAKRVRRAFVLATEGTVALGTYQKVCEANDIAFATPSWRAQALVTDVIRAVKRGDLAHARRVAMQIAPIVTASGCDAVILGCTELPFVQNILAPPGCTAIDTLAVLADACVRYTHQSNLVKEKL